MRGESKGKRDPRILGQNQRSPRAGLEEKGVAAVVKGPRMSPKGGVNRHSTNSAN